MPFVDFNSFEKDTMLLNSDRVILNSKDDSVFIISKKTVGTSASEAVHFNVGPRGSKDSKYVFIVNSPKIQLGMESEGASEPIAKGESTVKLMTELMDALSAFSTSLSQATALGVGVSKIPDIAVAANLLKLKLSRFKEFYCGPDSPIKSKVTNSI